VKGSNHELFKAESEDGTVVVLKKFTFKKNAELTGLCKSIYAVQKLQDRGVTGIIRITGIVHGEQGGWVYTCVCVCVCKCMYGYTQQEDLLIIYHAQHRT